MSDPTIAIPAQSPLNWYLEGAARGGIARQAGTLGGRPFPPRLTAGGIFPAINMTPLARSGIVHSVTRVEARTGAYLLALIDLDGGGRLLARLRGSDDPASMIERHAVLVDDRVEGEPFLTFQLAAHETAP